MTDLDNRHLLQKIYDEAKDNHWVFTVWFPNYNKYVEEFILSAKNNSWEDEIWYEFFRNRSNDVSSLRNGYFTNKELDAIESIWDETLAPLFMKIAISQSFNEDVFWEIETVINSYTKQNRIAGKRRLIASVLPSILATFIADNKWKPFLKDFKKNFCESFEITDNWYIDNYSLICLLKEKVSFDHPWHVSLFPWYLYEEYLSTEAKINFKTRQPTYKQKKHSTLPFAIKEFNITNFHNIKKIKIKNIPRNIQWIFLTGENGYGKTSILQATTIALLGKNEDEGFLLDKNKIFKDFVFHFEDVEVKKIDNFATYGAVRLNKSADRFPKTNSMFRTDGALLDIEAKLREWHKTEFLHDIYEIVKDVFLKLLHPYIDKIRIDIDLDKKAKIVKYHETDSEKDVWLEYNELASGYKSIIATFGDMIIRLAESNRSGVKDLSGIVLIDEFDLHLHPKWQKELVEKLTMVFPKVQFIVSTHSPIPLLGAPENSIVINVDRDKENGITAKILDVDFKNLTPNSILTSPIFNFRSIIPNSNKDLKDLVTADDYDEALFQKIVKQKLDDFVAENDADYKTDNE